MAIQTRGFGVSQMPHYTPVDPSLLAFNPQNITNGALSTIQIGKLLQQMAYQKKAQEELDATRAGRLGAENARNKSLITLAEPLTNDQLADLEAKSAIRPFKTEGTLANLALGTATDKASLGLVPKRFEYEGAKLGSDLSLLGPVTAAKMSEANAAKGNADIQIATQKDRLTTAAAVALGDAQRAQQMEQLKDMKARLAVQAETFNTIAAPNEFMVRFNEINDRLKNATSDAELGRELKKADIELKKANADYARGLGRQAGGSVKTLDQQIEDVMDNIKKLGELPIENGQKFSVYSQSMFDPNGKVANSPWFPGGNTEADVTPQAKIYREQMARLRSQLESLTAKTALPRSSDSKPAALPKTGLAPAKSANQDAIEWLAKNPNDPRAPAVRAKLGISQ